MDSEAMDFDEQAVTFACDEDWLYGVLSVPRQPCTRGVLIVVGGPQYRAGSHRQFTLLARHLASQGIAAMRFDYRGMGDSGGAVRSFEQAGDDIAAAIGHFMATVPQLHDVVIWGLCDGATAALLYAPADPRVSGLVLLNPWAHTDQGQAKTVLKHYYTARLRDPAFWRKLAAGQVRFGDAFSSLGALIRRAAGARRADSRNDATSVVNDPATPLPERLYRAYAAYRGQVLLITCDPDLTAQEFLDMTRGTAWQTVLQAGSTVHHRLEEADHTCSQRSWRDQVAGWTSAWVRSW